MQGESEVTGDEGSGDWFSAFMRRVYPVDRQHAAGLTFDLHVGRRCDGRPNRGHLGPKPEETTFN